MISTMIVIMVMVINDGTVKAAVTSGIISLLLVTL